MDTQDLAKRGDTVKISLQSPGKFLETSKALSEVRTLSQNSWKIRGTNNLIVKTREINNIKTRHKAIKIDIENLSIKDRSHTPDFRSQDPNWDEWCKLLDNNLSQFVCSFPNEVFRNIIDDQSNLFVNIITTSASSV